MSIILRLDRVMADRKISLNELSERVGVSNVNLSKLKTGKVSAIQAFFKNEEKGINPAGFEDMPDDTLFFQYHIISDEIWEGIKDGTWKGFSLAGTFNIKPVEFSKKANVLNEIEGLLEKIAVKIKK